MRWVRCNRRFGACLALAALALQLLLSFGHVHLDGIRGAAPSAVGAPVQTPHSPPVQQPGNDADDYCAICASIQLAANSLLPQAPQLPVPFTSLAIRHVDRVAGGFRAPRRPPFQSRAPPLA